MPENASRRAPQKGRLELWGGVECTVARIGGTVRNQILETGHFARLGDLDQIAALGIRTLRYPVLWETVAPDRPEECEWGWHDERLNRLRILDIRPIAGLVHHGSGPHYTSLVDPGFADGLARYASAVARRYPWIDMFTPVNEPLTTARFSGLYGHWYPHGRDYPTFLRSLVIQCQATVLAMRAIRKVTPAAQLVQTEDLGRIFSTARLADQAAMENERRWLSLDLLCGRVDRTHPWYEVLREAGVSERDIGFFLDGDCAPDIMGINHYLTSDRFLDQRLRRYPKAFWGGNGSISYADVEAVRVVLPEQEIGVEARLREAWSRYRIPLAVTEVHHGCTREEQLRWLMEVWQVGARLRDDGVDLRAVTIWSLFGAVDWNTLLTQVRGSYEPGAFDIRAKPPRPTALAKAAAGLAHAGRFEHPVLEVEGWWRRPDRFYGRARGRAARTGRPVLIIGSESPLGRTLAETCHARGLEAVALTQSDSRLWQKESVGAALAELKPWAVVDATGVSPGVQRPPRSEQRRRILIEAKSLAFLCARDGTALISFSSDAVFDGTSAQPYVEDDPVTPSTAFGRRQAEAECRALQHHCKSLIVRSGPMLSSSAEGFLANKMHCIATGRSVFASAGQFVSPAFLPDLAHAALDLLIDGESGIWHLASRDTTSAFEIVQHAAKVAGLNASAVRRRDGESRCQALSSARGILLPPVQGVIERWALCNLSRWQAQRSR